MNILLFSFANGRIIFMKESAFQARLIKRLKDLFPGCVVLKNDAGYLQGFPDLTVLYRNRWAVLECKQSERSRHQPNQDFYVDYLDGMGFARFIFPENEEDVLRDLERAFRPEGQACGPWSE